MVAMRRRAERLREGAHKVIEAQIDEFCESRQRNLLREMLLDEFDHPFLLPFWQAAANWACRGGGRSFLVEEFGVQPRRHSLRILVPRTLGISSLRLWRFQCGPEPSARLKIEQ